MIKYKNLPELAVKYISENFNIGDILPSEVIMSELIGVNRHTYRCALTILNTRGIISVGHGKVTRVISSPLSSEEHY